MHPTRSLAATHMCMPLQHCCFSRTRLFWFFSFFVVVVVLLLLLLFGVTDVRGKVNEKFINEFQRSRGKFISESVCVYDEFLNFKWTHNTLYYKMLSHFSWKKKKKIILYNVHTYRASASSFFSAQRSNARYDPDIYIYMYIYVTCCWRVGIIL